MLRMKKVKLELTSDADMYFLFEKTYERWSLLHIYITKQTIIIQSFMTENRSENILYTVRLMIYMVVVCLNFIQILSSNFLLN